MENKEFTIEQRVELLEKKVQKMAEFIMEFEEYNEIVERQMLQHIKENDPELYKLLRKKHISIPK